MSIDNQLNHKIDVLSGRWGYRGWRAIVEDGVIHVDHGVAGVAKDVEDGCECYMK